MWMFVGRFRTRNHFTNDFHRKSKHPFALIQFLTKRLLQTFAHDNTLMNFSCSWIDQVHKSQNAPAPYPTMLHSEQKCAHFCSEQGIMGYGTGAFWDLWMWFIAMEMPSVRLGQGALCLVNCELGQELCWLTYLYQWVGIVLSKHQPNTMLT